ncbi:MAG TPA: nucleotide exchange factor GrpE [Elusimicrobia bacterium]|nr:nucleotide exchange factor GrpE [Elusimicrobiota bacterium]HBT61477.1 nucleotide exchange factor GrpE [Elusimicrobiota bacterium]
MSKAKNGPANGAVKPAETLAEGGAEAAQTGQEPAPDYLDQLLRLKAEFENFRKRVDREKPEFFKLGKVEVLAKLLPLYDLMQRAHHEVQSAHNDTPLAKGMEGIFKEFEKLFKEEGVVVMEPAGKPFDALRHEVFGTVDRDDCEEGCVVDVLQNGFLLQDRVLRTAKVRIARKPKKEDGPGVAGPEVKI